MAELGPGSAFGEIALLTGAPRTATAICHQNVDLAVLKRESYNRILSFIKMLLLILFPFIISK